MGYAIMGTGQVVHNLRDLCELGLSHCEETVATDFTQSLATPCHTPHRTSTPYRKRFTRQNPWNRH